MASNQRWAEVISSFPKKLANSNANAQKKWCLDASEASQVGK